MRLLAYIYRTFITETPPSREGNALVGACEVDCQGHELYPQEITTNNTMLLQPSSRNQYVAYSSANTILPKCFIEWLDQQLQASTNANNARGTQ